MTAWFEVQVANNTWYRHGTVRYDRNFFKKMTTLYYFRGSNFFETTQNLHLKMYERTYVVTNCHFFFRLTPTLSLYKFFGYINECLTRLDLYVYNPFIYIGKKRKKYG